MTVLNISEEINETIKSMIALAGWHSRLEHHLIHQKVAVLILVWAHTYVADLIPDQGRQLINAFLPLSLSQKQWTCPWVRIFFLSMIKE